MTAHQSPDQDSEIGVTADAPRPQAATLRGDEGAEDLAPPQRVDSLTPSMAGVWLVETRSSRHIWDLDSHAYQRLPGPTATSMDHDRAVHKITAVRVYPAVGQQSVVFYDDPTDPNHTEQWRVSATILSITRVTGNRPADP